MPDAVPAQSDAAGIIERLLGATGEPDRVVEAGRALGERLLKSLRGALDEATNEPVAIEVDTVEVDRMAQLVASAGEHDAALIATAQISPDALALRTDPQAIAVFVNALFGAETDTGTGRIGRNLSPVELDVANYVFRLFAAAYNASNPAPQKLRAPLAPASTGAELKELAVRDGPAVRIDFAVGGEADKGRISVFTPQRLLLKSRATDALPDTPDAQTSVWKARFNDEVMRSNVRLEATMPAGKITLGEIAAFSNGQIVELPRSAPIEATLSANNRHLFVCEFGRLGQNYTVRIRNPAGANADLIDGIAFP